MIFGIRWAPTLDNENETNEVVIPGRADKTVAGSNVGVKENLAIIRWNFNCRINKYDKFEIGRE